METSIDTEDNYKWVDLLKTSLPSSLSPLYRENILVLDVFFEALNYETIEQKKAYEVAGLLGEYTTCLP